MDIKERLKQLEIESNKCTEIKNGKLVIKKGLKQRYDKIKQEYLTIRKLLN